MTGYDEKFLADAAILRKIDNMEQQNRQTKYAVFIKPIFFVTILIIILSLLSVMVRPADNDVFNLPNYIRTLDNVKREKENTIDVIFAGDSEASDAFSPLQFWGEQGISSFNIANPAQILPDSYALMAQIVKEQKPKVLVLETSCMYLRAYIHSDDPWLARAEKLFPILHYHQVYRLLKPKNVDFQNVEKTDSMKGFWLKTNIRGYEGSMEYMGPVDMPAEALTADCINVMNQFYDLCKEHDIQLILTTIPAPAYWTYSKHNGVKGWADEHSVPYIDMNLMHEELQMDWSQDTSDGGIHLSFPGTIKVCRWLGQYLKDTYQLKDHRGDPLYDSWKSAYEETNLYGGTGA